MTQQGADLRVAPRDLASGSITAAAQVDVYSFTGQIDDRALVTLGETSGFSGTIDAQVTVLAPSGAVLTSFDANAQHRKRDGRPVGPPVPTCGVPWA